MTNSIDERPATAPEWVTWPARVIAVIVVLPVRLLWEATKAAGRFVLTPLGRLWRNLVAVPVGWAWRNLVVFPLGWVWRHLIVVPVGWLARMVWSGLTTVGSWIGAALRVLVGVPALWVWRRLVVPFTGAVRRWVLRPVLAGMAAAGRFVVDRVVVPVGEFLHAWVARPIWWLLRAGWQGTSWLGQQIYRWVLRPVGIVAVWVWRCTFGALFRGAAIAWRATVVPAGRWLRGEILRPAGEAARSALAAMGLRR